MKKIKLAILAISALFFAVFGNVPNSIVGEWMLGYPEVYGGMIINSDGTGYVWEWEETHYDTTIIDSLVFLSENELIAFFHKGDYVAYDEYTFTIVGRKLVLCEDGLYCKEYIRKDPTSISPKQRTQTSRSFQINQNSNSLNLNFSANSQKRIEILNLQGRVLNSQSFSTKNKSVSIANLPRGVFFLRVFEGGNVNSVKFVRE